MEQNASTESESLANVDVDPFLADTVAQAWEDYAGPQSQFAQVLRLLAEDVGGDEYAIHHSPTVSLVETAFEKVDADNGEIATQLRALASGYEEAPEVEAQAAN